jgi:hypothetical protein
MKTLPIVCAALLFAGPVLAEMPIKPKDWITFRAKAIGCINFDDAIEAERLMRETKQFEAAKFVERQHAMAILGDQNRDCEFFDERDDRKWPVWEMDFGSSKLKPGTLAICISSPDLMRSKPPGACGFWVIVRLRDIIKK